MVFLVFDKKYEENFAKSVGCQWIEALETGTFGVISLVKKCINGQEKNIVMKRQCQSSNYKEEYEVHKHLWDKGGCENIIKILSMETFENDVAIFLEYAECRDILNLIPFLTPSRAQFYFRQLITGLQYIHSKGVIHRDIKPDNLFLTDASVLKIGDFGLSEFYQDDNGAFQVLPGPGTTRYAAPEVFLKGLIDGPPTDIWSAGVVLLNMVSNDQPWQEAFENDEEYQKYVKKDLQNMKLVWDFVEEKSKALVLKILTVNASERITIEEIQNDPWFKVDV